MKTAHGLGRVGRVLAAVAAGVAAGAVCAQNIVTTTRTISTVGGGGQFGPGGIGASVTRGDLKRYAERLALDDDQQVAVDAIYDAYLEEVRAMSEAAQKKLEEVQEAASKQQQEGGGINLDTFFSMMTETATKAEAAEKKFFEDFKAMLTPAQAEQWPGIQRDRRREQELSQGFLAGEQVDVVQLVNELELPAATQEALSPTLDQYAVELDRLLVERQADQKAAPIQPGTLDFGKLMEQAQQRQEQSKKVRDANLQYARRIEGMLPAEYAERFAERVRVKTFPRIYGKPSWALGHVDTALGMTDLDATQRTAVEALKGSVQRDLDSVNKDLEAAWLKREENNTVNAGFLGGGSIQISVSNGDGQEDENSVDGLLRRRRELEENADAKLRALLKPEQAQSLPQPPEMEPPVDPRIQFGNPETEE